MLNISSAVRCKKREKEMIQVRHHKINRTSKKPISILTSCSVSNTIIVSAAESS